MIIYTPCSSFGKVIGSLGYSNYPPLKLTTNTAPENRGPLEVWRFRTWKASFFRCDWLVSGSVQTLKKSTATIQNQRKTQRFWNLRLTLRKFNSSPLKSYRDPIGKDHLPTIMAFRGELLNFGGVTALKEKSGSFNLPPAPLEYLWRVLRCSLEKHIRTGAIYNDLFPPVGHPKR